MIQTAMTLKFKHHDPKIFVEGNEQSQSEHKHENAPPASNTPIDPPDELVNFIRSATHDLREPLRTIECFGGFLQTEYGDVLDQTGCDYISRMRKAAKRIQKLTDDMSAYSNVLIKTEDFVPINLETLTHDVLSQFREALKNCNAQTEVGKMPTLQGDAVQMRRLLENLIENAIKYRRDDQALHLKIDAKTTEHQSEIGKCQFCQIAVQDNGIGFDTQYAERIFNPFERLHGRGKYEGTGIGLALCRKIATHHNGTIEAFGQVGNGAIFTVTLPLNHMAQGLIND